MSLETVVVVLTAKSHVVHGSDEKSGVDSMFRRARFSVNGRTEDIPIISGNALRGRLRRVAAERYFALLGLAERSVPAWLYHACTAGGSIQRGSEGGKMGIADRRAVRENVPFLSLWGTAWKSDILQGKLTVGMLLPICSETEEFTAVAEPRSIHEFLDEMAFTRKDDRESKWIGAGIVAMPRLPKTGVSAGVRKGPGRASARDKPAKPGTGLAERSDAVQMLYRVEALVPGTRFAGRFVLDDANAVEAACFADTVAAWRENPTIGGKSSGGFGRVEMAVVSGTLSDAAPYAAYVAERRDAIREWLRTHGVSA